MKKNRRNKGFSLLEVVIAIALFSSIITVLGTAFFQITKSLQSVVRLHFFDTRIFVIQNLLEKEIAGVFIPSFVEVASKEGVAEVENSAKNEQLKNEEKGLEKAFFVTRFADGNLKEMRFVTSNPAAVYNTAKPRFVLIIYELIKDAASQNFILQRTESTIFDPQGIEKKTGPFVVAEGIKAFSVKLYGEKEKKEDKDEEKKKEKEPRTKREFEEKMEWNSDDFREKKEDGVAQNQQEKKEETSEEKLKPLPAFISFSLVLSDALSGRTSSVEFICSPLYGVEKITISLNQLVEQQPAVVQGQKENEQSGKSLEQIKQTPLSPSLQAHVEEFKANKAK